MPRLLRLDQRQPQPSVIEAAAAVLGSGGTICILTDTCYGLSCSACSSEATRRLQRLKTGRIKPFVLLVKDARQARRYVADWSENALALEEAFWPGPLTLVVPFCQPSNKPVAHSKETIALRIPSSAALVTLINQLGTPIWSTSANNPGQPAPSCIEQIPHTILDLVDLTLDSGPSPNPTPSTIIDLTRPVPTLIRSGPITADMIKKRTGIVIAHQPDE